MAFFCTYIFIGRLAFLASDANQQVGYVASGSYPILLWYTLANYNGALPSVYGTNQVAGTAGNTFAQYSFYATLGVYGN